MTASPVRHRRPTMVGSVLMMLVGVAVNLRSPYGAAALLYDLDGPRTGHVTFGCGLDFGLSALPYDPTTLNRPGRPPVWVM